MGIMLQHTLFCTFLSYHYIPTACHTAVTRKGMDSSNTRINLGHSVPGGTVYIHWHHQNIRHRIWI